MNTKRMDLIRLPLGDAAIDGLLKGILAGIVMLLYLVITGIFLGDEPVWVLTRFSPGEGSTPLIDLLVHLGVSAIYGVLFGLVCWSVFWRRQGDSPRWVLLLTGMVYGLALWLIAQLLLLPGTGSNMAEFAAGNLAMAHLIFGAVLGLTVMRSGSS